MAPIGPGTEAVRRYVSSAPKPPPGATGLTHNTSRPVPSPVRALTPPPTRPNTLFEGGGWSKEEYAMTQPVWPRRRHARMCWKSPPRSEERRVGKERRAARAREQGRRRRGAEAGGE